MGENSKIEWTTHTFNPWRGCSVVHAGCDNCYAAAMAKRNPKLLGVWGDDGTRVMAAPEQWHALRKWNAAAERADERARVFCASLADVFEEWNGPIMGVNGGRLWHIPNSGDNADVAPVTMAEIRALLFQWIDATPWLDWLLLTKRPENVRRLWPMKPSRAPIFPGMPGPLGEPLPCLVKGAWRPNVWLLTSISDQDTANEWLPRLLQCRDLVPVLGLSAEPLLGPIRLRTGIYSTFGGGVRGTTLEGIDWVIVGGESGYGIRPCDVEWVRSLRDQCRAADVPVFIKQLGSRPYDPAWHGDGTPEGSAMLLNDFKGGDWSEWPQDLRVREFPMGQAVL